MRRSVQHSGSASAAYLWTCGAALPEWVDAAAVGGSFSDLLPLESICGVDVTQCVRNQHQGQRMGDVGLDPTNPFRTLRTWSTSKMKTILLKSLLRIGSLKRTPSVKAFQCPKEFCGFMTDTEDKLAVHVDRVHGAYHDLLSPHSPELARKTQKSSIYEAKRLSDIMWGTMAAGKIFITLL